MPAVSEIHRSTEFLFYQVLGVLPQCEQMHQIETLLQDIRDIIFFLSSHRWEELVKEGQGGDMVAIDRLVCQFFTLLQARHQCY